jgi:hypothetical protein
MGRLGFRRVTLRVRVINRRQVSDQKKFIFSCLGGLIYLEVLQICGWVKRLAKSRGISSDIQSPRTRLLYLIYSAPNSRIKAAPGTKSNIAQAIGYKSDGHFHYDWNYLISAGMIEEKQGYYQVTETGKKEFALYSTQAMSNWIMVVMGVAIVSFTVGIRFGFLPVEIAAAFGVALILVGASFLFVGGKTKPKLSEEAKALLKELK